MSNPNPKHPRRRRPIAGERKPSRPGPATPPATDSVVMVADPVAGPAPVSDADPARPEESARPAEPAREGRGVPLPVLAGLALLALALVAVAAFVGVPALRTVRAEDQQQEARRTAPAAAERAAAAILSYDYRSLDADRASAVRHMTEKYQKAYVDTFDSLVRSNATKLKAKVDAKVVASGVSDAGEDRANVLVFVDQTTTSTANGGEPQVALNRVMLDMVRRDGGWKVNDITSY